MIEKSTLLHYATLAVPRYTSYPTAADFVAVSDDSRALWLSGIKDKEAVSLYLHVPYCRDICYYCGCHTKAARRDDVIDSYGETLVQDIKLQAAHLKGRPRVVHLHWGGGTPSILPRQSFEAIMEALHTYFDFDENGEHAIELDPRTVTPQLVETLKNMGVNRASLGVQDVNAQVQEAIGRVQPTATVERATRLLREAGITRINFDLIYGLPLQTSETLHETCRVVGAMQPDRVACYGYAHLPKRKANQKLIDEKLLPDAQARFDQAEIVRQSFEDMGYESVGIDHYAKPDDPLALAARNGVLKRNFQGYTDDDCPILIGFGCSSISQYHQGFAQTIADIGQYRRMIGDGKMATVRGIATNDDDRMRSDLIAQLMCNFEVDLADFGGRDRFAREISALAPIIADGLVDEKAGIIRMREEGRPFVRAVAALFDTYRAANRAQFSAAV